LDATKSPKFGVVLVKLGILLLELDLLNLILSGYQRWAESEKIDSESAPIPVGFQISESESEKYNLLNLFINIYQYQHMSNKLVYQ